MSVASREVLADPTRAARGDTARRRERLFFGGMAVALAITVFVGFAPTYYLHSSLGGANELTPSLLWHGAAFSAWVLLLVTQTSLVAARRVDLHRLLGVAGAALAVVMMVLGAYVAVTRMADGSMVSPLGMPRFAFLSVPLATVVVFPILFGAALWHRKHSAIHKRLVLIATLELVTAAIARWPVLSTLGPIGFFGGTDLFLAAIVVYDLATGKRVHPATLWGGLLLVASQPLRLLIGLTPQWETFSVWLTS
jgi:hypothetical protein